MALGIHGRRHAIGGADPIPGLVGSAGQNGGPITIPYAFSTTTTDSDPGNGTLRLGSATQNAATVIRADLLDSGGTDWTSVLATFAASTNAVKGHIRLVKTSDATKWLVFTVSAVAGPTGYKNVTVANVGSSASSPFSNGDAILLMFERAGDAGTSGAGTTGVTVQQAVPLDTPDAGGNAYPALTTNFGFTHVRRVVPTLDHGVDSTWEGSIRIPQNYASGGKIKLRTVANATSGAFRHRVSSAVVASGAAGDPAYTDESYVNTTVAATANNVTETSFTLSTTPAAGSDLYVKVTRQGTNAGDTLTTFPVLILDCVFEFVST